MSMSAKSSTMPSLARLIAHIRTPLYRNSYALVFNSAATSGIGVVYWMLAARNYTTEAIGLNSALMSAMFFLANMSQFNLVNVMNRFIPAAGRSTVRMVVYAYLISLAAAVPASLIFVLGANVWAPKLGLLGASPLFILAFTLSTIAWSIFALQDSVLVGLRQATWVPVENIAFALVKIALLVGFAKSFPQYGVFASWAIPFALLILPTNLLIFRRLIPQHVHETKDRAEQIVLHQIVRYAAGDYISSLIWLATTNLLPVLIVQRAGATANAYFYLAWTIAYSLYLVSRSTGMSLIAEASTDQAKLNTYSYQTLVQTARLLVPMEAVMLLGAPYILSLFGTAYAREATAVFRLLCLSALPNAITSLYIDIARVQRRMTAIVVVLISLCVLVVTLSYILLGIYGITGIGIAWLLGQTLIAAVLLLTQLRTAWLPHLNVQILLRLLAFPRGIWWRWSHRRRVESARNLVLHIVPTISAPADMAPPPTWTLQNLVRTVNEVMVITLGSSGQPAAAVLKLPQTDLAAASLWRQTAVLKTLRADPRLADWCALLPALLAENEGAGQPYLVEQMLPGLDARSVVAAPAARTRMQVAAAATIGQLHRRTAACVGVDARMMGRWIDEPLFLIRCLYGTRSHSASVEKVIDRLASELHGALEGRKLCVSWVHGDFVPGNILVTHDGGTLTGIVDWDLAAPNDLPMLDLIQLFLSTRMLVQHQEMGDLVRDLLDGARWTPHEYALLNEAQSALPGDALEMRATLLLCWLRHVGANLTKSTGYAGHWLWVTKNIQTVLESL